MWVWEDWVVFRDWREWSETWYNGDSQGGFFFRSINELIICYDQGLGNGFPISGVISRTELTDRLKPGSMVCTYLLVFFFFVDMT